MKHTHSLLTALLLVPLVLLAALMNIEGLETVLLVSFNHWN